MKVLVIYREDTARSAALPPQFVMETIHATAGWLKEIRGSGKATEATFMAADHGGMAVFQASTAAELMGLVESCPARPICRVEVIPLIDADDWKPVMEKVGAQMAPMLERLAAMQKK